MFQFIQESFRILVWTISIPGTYVETVDLILISQFTGTPQNVLLWINSFCATQMNRNWVKPPLKGKPR